MAWDKKWGDFTKQKQYPTEDFIRFIAGNFYASPNRGALRMMEVGFGGGANLWYLAREGFQVYGVEGSESATQAAIRRLNEECPGWKGEVLSCDAITLPFSGDMFDAVIDRGAVLCNSWENSIIIYQEMLRVCKPGGRLFTNMYTSGSYGFGMGEKVGHNAWHDENGFYIRYTEQTEIAELLKGWNEIQINLTTWTEHGINSGRVRKQWVVNAVRP